MGVQQRSLASVPSRMVLDIFKSLDIQFGFCARVFPLTQTRQRTRTSAVNSKSLRWTASSCRGRWTGFHRTAAPGRVPLFTRCDEKRTPTQSPTWNLLRHKFQSNMSCNNTVAFFF